MTRMSLFRYVAAGLVVLSVVADAQMVQATKTAPPAGFTEAIVLWPGGAPLAQGTTEGDVPKLLSYPAAGPGPHVAVVVMPGGGYTHVVMEKEGAVEARWLNAHGVSAYVLEYRLAPAYKYPAAMLDGARAVRYVRSHAAELGVDAGKVGVWGFSAGGHLAGYISTMHDAGNAANKDAIERVSDRPDFAVFSYARLSLDNSIPRNGSMETLLGVGADQAGIDSIDVVKHVTADTPSAFLYSTSGDQTVDARNATAYYNALKKLGIPAELHIFERGVHGTGMGQGLKPDMFELTIWPTLLANWMTQNGWMPAATVAAAP